MNDTQVLAYVQASAIALGLSLDAERAQRVAGHMARTFAMAKLLEDVPMHPDNEIVEIYSPLVFQPLLNERK